MLPPGLKLAWYGDDFTGASDTLATLAEAGLKARLFLDVPTPEQLQHAGELDAMGIAGAARAMAPEAMRAALAPVARFFAGCGAPVLHYKCCSTFDSAPHAGSLGEAVRIFGAALGGGPALIVGGQPSLGRYCAFGQLFATAEAGGEAVRIDRHPTMSRHPVTPMDEADLRLHLRRQGLERIGLLDLRAHEQADALDAAFDALCADAPQAVLMDVVRESQLGAIGRLLWQRAQQLSHRWPQLCVGASSVAQALIDHWGLPRRRHDGRIAPANGPVLVLAGSLSPLTARQVAAAQSFQRLPLDAQRLARGDAACVDQAVDELAGALQAGRHVLAHTTPLDRPGGAADAALAAQCGRLLRQVLMRVPVSRLGVAGGDTSSHALQALAPTALSWLGRPAPGVALCRAHAAEAWLDGTEVMLKGGQMGGDDLFEVLVAGH